MRTKSASLQLCTLLFSILLFPSQLLANGNNNETSGFFQPPLLSKAINQGTVSVLVKLNVNTRPQETLSSRGKTEQRGKIHRSSQALSASLDKFKPKRQKYYNHLPYVAMELDADALRAAMTDPEVAEIYEDHLTQLSLAESTSLVGATTFASSGSGGSGQVVAVLDTGVDKSHPFLAGKVVHEACFSKTSASSTSLCPNGSNTQVGSGAAAICGIDGCSHGTHVAGIAAGKGSSFSGVAPEADVMAVQVFSRFEASYCGGSAPCVLSYTSDMISALDHVYSQRTNFNIASVNMSLGGGSYSSACDNEPIKAAIDLLKSAGIATVIASGNDSNSSSISYPACVSSAISVGATSKTDTVASYSNSAGILDLLAPGSSIQSSIPGSGYAYFSGTSMATPHVAGAFAALRSSYPTASVDKILGVLKSRGKKILDSRNNITTPRIQVNLSALALSSTGLVTQNDFDSDGRADILWRNTNTGSNKIFHMDGAYIAVESPVNPVADTNWKIAGIGDVDGDGDADILWRNAITGDSWIFLMNGASVTGVQHLFAAANLNWEIADLADLDGNGTDDIVWRNRVSGENWLFLLNGNTITQSSPLPTVIDTNWKIAGVTDLDGDQKADILWRNSVTGVNWVYLMDGANLKASSYLNTVADLNWQIIGMTDLNNDKKSDLIWSNSASGLVWSLLMDGTTITASAPVAVVTDNNWQVKQTSDFNGDGNSDILWRNSSTGQNWVFLMNGSYITQSTSLNTLSSEWNIISK